MPSVAFSKSLKVVIIDTGVDSRHSILYPYIKKEIDFSGSKTVSDDDGHGTHIAGLVVGAGSIPSDIVEVISIKLLTSKNSEIENLYYLLALRAAINENPDVINISFTHENYLPIERSLLELASRKGIKVVASAGNKGSNLDKYPVFPCSYKVSSVICVGNGQSEVKRDKSSNYGSRVKVWRPGNLKVSSIPGNEVGIKSGSSQSAAIYSHEIILEKIKSLTKK